MKLLTSYGNTFAEGLSFSYELYNLIKQDTSCNGLYLAHPDFINYGYIGQTTKVETWYNALFDTNYLYTSAGTPTLTINDSQFNNYPAINFPDTANTQLLFKNSINVGTVIIVYLTRVSGSYILYAPRSLSSGGTVTWYDAFPSGGVTLWSQETLTNNSIYNASSYINGKSVTSNVFIPLNSARILTITNIANASNKEALQGIGGRIGTIGGTTNPSLSNTVRGKVAAIITFENIIDPILRKNIELLLAKYYIQYNGVVLTSTPTFKYILGSTISYDFGPIAIDEWFSITNYELLNPTGYGLSFSGSVLSGSTSTPINTTLQIKITNSNGDFKIFSFPFQVVKSDPILLNMPSQGTISLALSAESDGLGNYYGINKNINNEVTSWEDARRITTATPTYPNGVSSVGKYPSYSSSNSSFNNKATANLLALSNLTFPSINGKTFIWVYKQTASGVRNMLDTFPDIKGTGELWTVSNISQVHGTTTVTKLNTSIMRVPVNTLNYQLPLNTPMIIAAIQPDNTAISFSQFNNFKGDLAFFICWNTQLTNTQLNTAISQLAKRYLNSQAPYIFDTNIEFKTDYNITVDLTKKLTQIDTDYLPLSYSINTPSSGGSITGDTLSYTAITDSTIPISITGTNGLSLSNTLNFLIDVTVRTNSLYLALKNLLSISIKSIFIPSESDTVTYSGSVVSELKEYRFNGISLTSTNVLTKTLSNLNNKVALDFAIGGSSDMAFSAGQTGKCFVVVYIRKENTINKSFLFGQTSTQDFSSGTNGILYDTSVASTNVINSDTYINGYKVDNGYYIQSLIPNIICINTLNNVTIDSIAKDRVFTDRSVKGYIPLIMILDRNITATEALNLNKLCRDYFQPAQTITLLAFDSGVVDISGLSKPVLGSGSTTTSLKKFGTAGYSISNNSTLQYLTIENNGSFAYQNEDFTIAFWLQLNRSLTSTDTLTLYSTTDLVIYISSSDLVIGRNLFSSLLTYTLPGGFFSASVFNHIQLCRKDRKLYLFVSGVLVGTVDDLMEYKDYSNPLRIGGTGSLITTGITATIDDYLVYRRSAFNITNFTPPTSAYLP